MTTLSTSFCREEVVPAIFFENMTPLGHSQIGCFGQDWLSEGRSRRQIDLIDPRLNSWIAVDGWSCKIEASHRLVNLPIVIEE